MFPDCSTSVFMCFLYFCACFVELSGSPYCRSFVKAVVMWILIAAVVLYKKVVWEHSGGFLLHSEALKAPLNVMVPLCIHQLETFSGWKWLSDRWGKRWFGNDSCPLHAEWAVHFGSALQKVNNYSFRSFQRTAWVSEQLALMDVDVIQ